MGILLVLILYLVISQLNDRPFQACGKVHGQYVVQEHTMFP
jgi:hypothetical protein